MKNKNVIIIILYSCYLILMFQRQNFIELNNYVRKFVIENFSKSLYSIIFITHNTFTFRNACIVFTISLIILFAMKKKKEMYCLLFGGILQASIMQITKTFLYSPRPPQEKFGIIAHDINSSFPSGHTTASMTLGIIMFSIIYKNNNDYKKYFGIIFILFAILTAFGRIYLDVHYFRDVLGGWMIAIASSLLAIKLFPLKAK